jgi:hypothetical protein
MKELKYIKTFEGLFDVFKKKETKNQIEQLKGEIESVLKSLDYGDDLTIEIKEDTLVKDSSTIEIKLNQKSTQSTQSKKELDRQIKIDQLDKQFRLRFTHKNRLNNTSEGKVYISKKEKVLEFVKSFFKIERFLLPTYEKPQHYANAEIEFKKLIDQFPEKLKM